MIKHAFIFVRGGSKGLPGKNIRPLAGKPLLAYSIESAKAVSELDKVFVSTDCPEIAAVARQYGAIVIERPPELAQDDTPEWLAWRHAIEWVRENIGDFDGFVSLPATSPLRSTADICNAIAKLVATDADICISVTPASRSPYFNMVKSSNNDFFELVIPMNEMVQHRQEAPIVYDITTVIYVTRPSFVMNNYGLFSGKVTAITVPKERAVDIDDIHDFRFAEVLLSTGVHV